jgi:hypothetical protein
MLMTKERQPEIRTPRVWAINVLQEAGAIHECEEHGWAKDRADPHARERAFDVARRDSAGRGFSERCRCRSARCLRVDRGHMPLNARPGPQGRVLRLLRGPCILR